MKKFSPCDSSSFNSEHLIGRLDLLGGLSVHVSDGKGTRNDLVRLSNEDPGNPLTLFKWYRDRGITRFYVTDLDARLRQPRQNKLIDKLCNQLEPNECLWLDCRVKATELQPRRLSSPNDLVQRILYSEKIHPSLSLVLEDPSLHQRSVFSAIGDFVDPSRFTMGMNLIDLANSKISSEFDAADNDNHTKHSCRPWCDEWLNLAHQAGIRSGFLLWNPCTSIQGDAEMQQIFQRWSERYNDWKWMCSGIRSKQESSLIHDCGCSGILVGTTRLPDGRVAIV
ncbi:Histidine biosynthesis protein [Rubripirellula obstinata]|uniref:Histidine biosynthesis protein n=1 Tax=Rubripirellula obstinata TaxID=406547 RepID=A0A5B1CH80_9BACT|nr:hypothetical protein [Rubripirellula obstinata]KAA1260548.1 Histidine biosynthesis protein [Rubripirellula obstinata]